MIREFKRVRSGILCLDPCRHFDGPYFGDVPKWARWYAIDENGYLYYYSSEPFRFGDSFGIWDTVCGRQRREAKFRLIPGTFNWMHAKYRIILK